MDPNDKIVAKLYAERLRSVRVAHDLTQEELADRIDVSVKTIQNWETGKKIPSYENLNALASFYNMNVSDLLDDDCHRLLDNISNGSRCITCESILVPGKIETFFEFQKDFFLNRYTAWIYDPLTEYKMQVANTTSQEISYEDFKNSVIERSERAVWVYRQWVSQMYEYNETEEDRKENEAILRALHAREDGEKKGYSALFSFEDPFSEGTYVVPVGPMKCLEDD